MSRCTNAYDVAIRGACTSVAHLRQRMKENIDPYIPLPKSG